MLNVEGVYKSYRKDGWFGHSRHYVLTDISFEWRRGECLGIIGESGSGKSTLGRLLLGIEKPDSGIISFGGKPVAGRKSGRVGLSAVFQDYTSSINPFFHVRRAMLEVLPRASDDELEERLLQVGLDASYLPKYPHELSGGEAQRVCIARAVATGSPCILLDEAISSLDGSVQMQVLELLKGWREKHGTGFIFITHDIQAAAYLCDRIMIIRHGRIEELVDAADLQHVKSLYAQELLRKVLL
ncbi:ABC transporter ATP-binding protein [Paenibacillus sp. NPDC057967]|uniref:ABC transporter ATP-binding protein n=1 Tax=Paenibacillus sp. NPDC057967 TaxID=3346293 RepID=UPI0036D84CAC